jgi:phosphatidylglycerophosphate synthase
METAKREMTFLLADVERRILHTIAAALPVRIRPNHLSGVGVVGAVGAGAAYALSAIDVRWLWAASLMLIVNWFGDSLDGTLARVRGIERPRYGYYLDHIIDAFNTAAVGIGIGLSPFVEIELALALVVVYLMLSVNVYLESSVFRVFRMAYGKIGPTEGRILLILGNVALVGAAALGVAQTSWGGWVTNGAASALVAAMLVVLMIRVGKNLRRLAILEPQKERRRGRLVPMEEEPPVI